MEDKYKNLEKEIELLKKLSQDISKIEGQDEALKTYYENYSPSELIDIVVDFMESGSSEYGSYT